MAVTWAQVHAWRMGRQYLITPAKDAVEVVGRLCGVQAQVVSSAELAVDVRLAKPATGLVESAVADRRLIRTWAMRGTLHLVTPADAPAFLSLLAALRTWEKPVWQRSFGVSAAQVAALAEAAPAILADRVLTREEFAAEIVAMTGHDDLAEVLRSGWGTVLKPLAWMGLLCSGPSTGNRVTFTSPATWVTGWTGLPEPHVAAATAIPAYLRAYGPASPDVFDRWLSRGTSKKAALRSWFTGLGDMLSTVDVEGEELYVLAEDAGELARTKPGQTVRLLPGFDQWVLGPGTQDPHVVPPERRTAVSKAGGWISPVVVRGGEVVGTWEVDDGTLTVRLFAEAGTVSTVDLAAEAERISHLTGQALTLTTTTV